MPATDILSLLIKKLHGGLSDSEESLFEAWLAESEENRAFYRQMKSLKGQGRDISQIMDLNTEHSWKKVEQKARTAKLLQKTRKGNLHWLRYAAIVTGLALLCYGGYTFLTPSELIIDDEDIVLQLGDGTTTVIRPDAEVQITDAEYQTVIAQQRDQLQYGSDNPAGISYNTLTVPYGKTFKVLLADGTRVHLNAGTSMTYPTAFLKNEPRTVSLQGEAYFEVARKPLEEPFIVRTGKLNTRVLGTKFNVSSYEDDTEKHIVLAKGSVAVYMEGDTYTDETLRIKPGEKATLTGTSLEVSEVIPGRYTAWMQNALSFNDDPFSNVLKKFERHYNVTIVNRYPELNNRRYNGTFREENIVEALDAFKKLAGLDYSINENQIIIKKP